MNSPFPNRVYWLLQPMNRQGVRRSLHFGKKVSLAVVIREMSSVDAYLLQVDRRQGLFACIGLCRIRLTFVNIPVRTSVFIDESIETRVLDGKVFDGDLTTKKVIEWLQRQGCPVEASSESEGIASSSSWAVESSAACEIRWPFVSFTPK